MTHVERHLVYLLLTVAASARAQVSTATITGTVQDTTGAVIHGAQVAVTEHDTHAVRTVTTGVTGDFTIPSLPVGEYSVTATMVGFGPFEQSGIVLAVNQIASFSITL